MKLALTFTCRALLVFLLPGSVQTDRTAPFLITENMWPRGCVLDCQRGRHRAVCGSNGRLYKSLCAFQRAQCINTQLRLAPRAHCSDLSLSKCQLARAQALEANAHSGGSHVSPAAAMFVPRCHQDGHFLPVQCHNQTGYCWCSTPDGKPLSGTSVLHLIPNCTDHITKLAQTTDADSTAVKDEVGEPGPTLDPRKSAELTAPPIWVTILMNSVRRPTDSPQTCERERASLLSQMHSAWQEERFIPECTADGRYSPVQCHTATGYCWCVRVDSGRPLSGTSARNRIPDCTGAEEDPDRAARRFREKPLPGCPGARKEQFLQSLVRALQLEAEHAGSPYRSANAPPSNAPSPFSNTPSSTTPSSSSSSSSSPLNVAPSTTLEAVDSSRPEEVLQWHFSQLDVDSSGVLSEREARPLRQFLRRRLKPRRCAKKFAQYCDRDGDRGLTLEELRVCLGL
ncbi:SPARC-related modular calcium-binding protein 1-like [Seriola lalandi dorsalis]|uniref:SPARC-related modular calcium-binding protein 1-like n=1 Tax=Seriola lalandi dorsalis TaxID=1841481 RepID=UPI000C6F8AA9|nr:SPARC-related modular calcium-binding protein 1-like [Seriola lalandi dorsalis]XP_023266079.1 SPARC-related modular calcium-binding protein 1-like [Seriola lalandi dorsalis]XP_056231108.1 SPARC-related modular calcium-binding protein 1-like [Seriola aureovittata]XP_056231109.1 SPARC-related modular calcium-binding protein 1-like [Seriola aureovittata]